MSRSVMVEKGRKAQTEKLHNAIHRGDFEGMKKAALAGAYLNDEASDFTAITEIVVRGPPDPALKLKMVKFLVGDAGAEPNPLTRANSNIGIAAHNRLFEISKYLSEKMLEKTVSSSRRI